MTRKPRNPPKPKRTRRRAAKQDPLDAVIDASARALELRIERKWKPSIRAHLQVILRHGALLKDFKLPDEAEPAPVFEP